MEVVGRLPAPVSYTHLASSGDRKRHPKLGNFGIIIWRDDYCGLHRVNLYEILNRPRYGNRAGKRDRDQPADGTSFNAGADLALEREGGEKPPPTVCAALSQIW